MSNLFEESINDKFIGAKHDKENSSFKEKISNSLKDPLLQDEWLQIKAKKHLIKEEADYVGYIDIITKFFNKVCEKITAPGVDAFIDWLVGLGFKHQDLLSLREFLIGNYQYAEYSEKVDFIQLNGEYVDYEVNSPKLFNELIKAVNKDIKDKVSRLIEKPELFETTVLEFLTVVNDELETISDIDELGFTDLNELFTEEQKKKSITFYQDIIKDAIAYLQQSPSKYPTPNGATTSTVINNKVTDLKLFIESLANFGLAQVADDRIKEIFEKSKSQIIGKEGTLKDNWTEFETKTWEELELLYTEIQNFFKERTGISSESLEKGKLKWNISSVVTEFKYLIDKYIETIEKNPLESLFKYNTYKGLREELLKKAKAIEEVKSAAAKTKIKLFDILNEKVADFDDHKIPVIDNIVIKRIDLQKNVQQIKDSVGALGKANTEDYQGKNFLSFLSTDFDSFYEYYNSVDSMYTKLLSDAGMKDKIEWLHKIMEGSEELLINDTHLEDVETLKELLKYNLVTITLISNS